MFDEFTYCLLSEGRNYYEANFTGDDETYFVNINTKKDATQMTFRDYVDLENEFPYTFDHFNIEPDDSVTLYFEFDRCTYDETGIEDIMHTVVQMLEGNF